MTHHPIEAAAVGAVIFARALRVVLVPIAAVILTVAGWQPGSTSQPQPAAMPGASLQLDGLTVAQLRIMARQSGFRSLARSGRRADLLAVLAG